MWGNKKLSFKDLKQIVFELKTDCFNSQQTISPETWQYSFYNGEANAFQIVLDLLEHIEE